MEPVALNLYRRRRTFEALRGLINEAHAGQAILAWERDAMLALASSLAGQASTTAQDYQRHGSVR